MISPIHIATDGYLLPLNKFTIMSNGYLIFDGQEVEVTVETTGGGAGGAKRRRKKYEEETKKRITVSVSIDGEKHSMTLETSDAKIKSVKDVEMNDGIMDKIRVFVRNIKR